MAFWTVFILAFAVSIMVFSICSDPAAMLDVVVVLSGLDEKGGGPEEAVDPPPMRHEAELVAEEGAELLELLIVAFELDVEDPLVISPGGVEGNCGTGRRLFPPDLIVEMWGLLDFSLLLP